MEKLNWRLEEVIGFLEDRISNEEATTYEEKLYERYHWEGKLDTRCTEFKMVLRTMKKLYNQ